MSPSDLDRTFMRRALSLAERGWGRVSPNPLVGAVIVRDGVIVGEGWHAEYGGPHAERNALADAGDRARGATAYVSLEPCSHHGKQPPCTEALLQAGIARVVFGAPDPNPVAGGGAEVLARAGLQLLGEVEERAARDQNARFFHAHSPAGAERPWIELKLALSLDACIADVAGHSHWITGEEARAEVHYLRAGHDAVGVGIGTAIADDPRLTVRGPVAPRVQPVRVVFDRTLRLPPGSQLARTARDTRVWVVAGPGAPAERRRALEAQGVRVLEGGNLRQALRVLRVHGVTSAFVEGGAELAAALLREDLVDRMTLFYAPLLLGAGALSPFAGVPAAAIGKAPRWRRLGTRALGPDTMISFARAD